MGLNLFPKYSNVEYMRLENAICVRFWWEAGALHDDQIWFNYRIYSQGWCWCLPTTSIPVFGDFINNLISKIWRSKLILHSCSQLYAFHGKYVSYLLWMKLLGTPVFVFVNEHIDLENGWFIWIHHAFGWRTRRSETIWYAYF